MNWREKCVRRLLLIERELDVLHPDDLETDELLGPVCQAAAEVERFVKRLDLKLGPRDSLAHYINELRARGLPVPDADALHALREQANAGKHQANAGVTLQRARELVHAACEAVSNVGVVGSAPGAESGVPSRVRAYAILVADHITGGEVEYIVCTLPGDGRIARLDVFQVDYRSEASVVADLERNGRLDRSPTSEEVELIRRALAGSTEFSGIWVYEGDLRDVQSAMAPYQHSDATPFLQRFADSSAVRSAIAVAMVDLGRDAGSIERLVAALRDRYALHDPRVVEKFAARAVALFASAGVPTFDGPRFAGERRFQHARASAIAYDDSLGMAVAVDGTLYANVGEGFLPIP